MRRKGGREGGERAGMKESDAAWVDYDIDADRGCGAMGSGRVQGRERERGAGTEGAIDCKQDHPQCRGAASTNRKQNHAGCAAAVPEKKKPGEMGRI
jgi:hypothetical protein